MITFKLGAIAKQRGKTVTQIAKETGLNRNTVTALFHNKVDGIKFDTLDILCRTYELTLHDLLEYQSPIVQSKAASPKRYRQECELVLFFCWPWLMATHLVPSPKIEKGYGESCLYACRNMGYQYWDEAAMNQYAQSIYNIYQDKSTRKKKYAEYEERARVLEQMYRDLSIKDVLAFEKGDILVFYENVWRAYQAFWQESLFIDSFDAGVDQQLIQTIAAEYHFTAEETAILTTPEGMTFHQERLLMLVNIAKRWSRHHEAVHEKKLRAFVQTDPEVALYRKTFDYMHSNYASVRHITEDEVYEDILKRVSDKSALAKEYEALVNYSAERRKKSKKVLGKYNLTENPLAFFEDLTFWREHRKKVNLVGFHLLDVVLDWLEQKSGIAKADVAYLCYDEIEAVLKGSITQDVLRRRREEGTVVIANGGMYQLIVGAQAASLRDELEENRRGSTQEQKVMQGQTASQGYAKARARVVLTVADFPTFQDGEVLVTGMTRPEFLPLMKRASAIVTNEGGITCHAAIVSRELGIPCVIGTKNATDIIKNGDIIEVRATHGTVRILKG